MTTKLFGERVPRVEDPRLVTGRGRFLDDLGHDALEAAFVRSPHAHARVLDVDVTGALDVDGLVAIYTYDDLAEDTATRVAEPLPLLIPHPTLTHGRTPYALAREEVNHVGEAVVMVVATSRYVAEDACERIRVDYAPLPAVVGIENARDGDLLVHDDVPGNVAAVMVQQTGDADAAVDAAPHRLELDLAIERSASMPLEGKGVLARWDADDESLLVHTSTQTSTSVRQAVAAKLGLPVDRVEVVTPDVGGGFGVKIVHPWPEEVLVPWAARRLGQPVKWTEDRREHFTSSAHERGQLHHVRVGYDDDGRLRGLSVRFWHDNGAYTPYGLIVPIITSTQLLGPYKPGPYRVEFTSLYTNTVLVTPYRGAGRPQGCFVMERVMDAVAADLGLDRTVVRERNFIQPEEMPYDQGLVFQDGRPLVYDSGDFPGSLAALKALVGWDDFETFRSQAKAAGRRVGIGLACYVEGTGVGPYEGGHIRVETDGSVVVSTGLTSQGQGHQTMLAQIVADELGVPFERIRVTTGDTRRFKYAVGTFASRTAVMSGSAVALTARGVRAKALGIAATALEADVEDLEIVDGHVQVKGAGGGPSASIDLGAVAVLSNPLRYAFDEAAGRATQFAAPADPDRPPVEAGQSPGLEGSDYYSPTRSTFANGMHAVVVETDPDTAEVRVLRYCVVHDCGTLVNPMIVEGQIHGGVAQGVGGALYERMVYGPDGQLLNASFMDFLMPYASEVPEVEIDHLVTPSPLNPLGVKGAGEAGVIPGSAAIAAAIEDAEGITLTRMPISPSELFALRLAKEHPVKIIGNAQLGRPPQAVYRALNDPAVLVACIPGCQRLQAQGDDAYAMTVAAGVGSIKGVYDGQVRLSDHDEPTSFVLSAQGSGAAGTIAADVRVTLEETDDGTSLTYDADATVGGMIGGVGQRMLVGVSKRMAAEFFDNVDAVLLTPHAPSGALPGDGAEPKPSGASRLPPGPSTVSAPSPGSAPGAVPPGAVFTAPTPQGGGDGSAFARGVGVGALAALAGALVGAWISRRVGR